MRNQAAANLEALIESTEDHIWSVDLHYGLITFNKAVERDYETSFGTHAAVGMRPEQLLPPELAANWPPLYERALSQGPFRCEYSFVNGHILELSLNPIVVDGKTTGISVFGKDITECKRTAEALAESEARFRTFFDENSSVMTLIDPATGEIVDANHAAAAFFGYPLERLVGMNLSQIDIKFPEELALELQQPLTKEHNVFTYRTRLASGEERDIEVYSTLFVLDGRLLRHGIIHDVTERKRAEKALHESEDRYRATFEQAAVGIVHTSFDGQILRCNARFAEIIGYPIEEIPSLTVQQITVLEDIASGASRLQQMAGGAASIATWEKRNIRKDGSVIWVRISDTLQRDTEGRPLYCIAVVEDINARKQAEELLLKAGDALRSSEERYRTAFKMSLDGINISRLSDGLFIDVNEAFLKNTGYAHEELVGHTPQEVEIWANPDDRKKFIKELLKNSVCLNQEAQFRRKDGTLLWGLLSASVIELDDVPCILTVVRDLSETKKAEERLATSQNALRASEARYSTAFEASPNAVNIFRLDDGMYLEVNKTFLETMGFEREEVIGRTSQELNIWADPSDLQDIVELLRQKQVFRGEIKQRKKNGETFWGLMSASVFEYEGTSCVLSVTQDISDVKAAQDEIRDLSFYDPLTRLPNRRLLLNRLRRSPIATARNRHRRALLFVDLDNFKSLNDTLGHQTGDLLLQEAALRLGSCVRDSDTVARCGGDEFAVMLENLSEVVEEATAQAQIVGEKILAICGLPYLLIGHECHCPSSVGITVFGDELESAKDALQRAEIAMFEAKKAGRNTLRFFAPALQAAVSARATMEEDLREAIKTNQFVLYYQPQVERGRLIGAEALLRWKHPRHGLLAPGEFIPLAEESGLILPLGDWVLEAACAQLALWAVRKEAAEIALAVNISARQFRQPNFVERVLAALARTGANPLTLKLELTESMLLDNVDDVIAKMTALKSHGMRLSLDDFGTGYSSLAYLKRLPLDELKIDLSFVRDILADAASGAIAQAILTLGKAMGLRVIAEGVETEEQRDFLIRMGCNSFQGFLFSRPLPLKEFQLWFPESAGSAAPKPKKARRSSSAA
jgi:diguanylate cyclase (GGDEF)-like protein/PAS domain S-box-containing protein